MPTLKEIKVRIGSVQSTLKITSVMKMVASAKFHRAQSATRAHILYCQRLTEILNEVLVKAHSDDALQKPQSRVQERMGSSVQEFKGSRNSLTTPGRSESNAVVVAFASNNSLCGRFNANAIKEMQQAVERLREEGYSQVSVIPVGEKMRQAVNKSGLEIFPHEGELAASLIKAYNQGEIDRVELVYNHFRSMGHQEPVCETFLPSSPFQGGTGGGFEERDESLYIFEPEPNEILRMLLPTVLEARLHTVRLDSEMAEHAARTVAMQTATDNAQELLDELSLSYNKQRQQNITNELADITQGQSK